MKSNVFSQPMEDIHIDSFVSTFNTLNLNTAKSTLFSRGQAGMQKEIKCTNTGKEVRSKAGLLKKKRISHNIVETRYRYTVLPLLLQKMWISLIRGNICDVVFVCTLEIVKKRLGNQTYKQGNLHKTILFRLEKKKTEYDSSLSIYTVLIKMKVTTEQESINLMSDKWDIG